MNVLVCHAQCALVVAYVNPFYGSLRSLLYGDMGKFKDSVKIGPRPLKRVVTTK